MNTEINLIRINELAIRYHQKTAAIIASRILLAQSFNEATKSPKLIEAIEDLDKLLAPNNLNIENHFSGMFLINIISETEMFYIDIVKEVIAAFPHKLGSHSLSLTDALNLEKDELILNAAETYLSKIMYKKPTDYLKCLGDILSIETNKFSDPWKVFVEAKARRDLGVHNNWLINDIYKRKLLEIDVDFEEKNKILIPNGDYLTQVLNGCNKILE